MLSEEQFDRRGWRRSPVTLPSYRQGVTPLNAGRKFPAEVLTGEEISLLIRACGRGPAGLRNRALIITMWRAGLRVAEALALRPKDIDTAAGTITVLHGKGNRRRTVGIDPQAMAVLERWLERRRRLGLDGRAPVFCVISKPTLGKPIHSSYVRDLLKKLARKAGIEKRVHPHGLRHTHAYELSMEGQPLNIIRAQLGHSSIATTARYVDHLAPAAVIAAMQGRQW